jgi:N-ethylmaleimide reductase
MLSKTTLFSPIKLGSVELANRILMAPLTRARSDAEHVPGQLIAQHYADRASAGLIITEATMVMENCCAFINEPGIYSEAQVEGWRKVTDAVHKKEGKIFLQLWHGGRACHPDLNKGIQPVAPSPIAIEDEVYTREGKKPYTTPRALELAEIPNIVNGFQQAAINAKAAGFDGVEVHGANGYLLDAFLRDSSNKRKDSYGGNIENRARLLLEVLDAVCDVWGSDKVGLRTSPLNGYNSMIDSDPLGLTRWLAERLSSYNLAYWHLMRSDFMGQQNGDVINLAREHYQGNLIGNMGYSHHEADSAIREGQLDAVAFGVPFIANPDLVSRFESNSVLNEADPNTFYTRGPEGYNDYPPLVQSELKGSENE